MKKRSSTTTQQRDFTYRLPAIRGIQAGQEYFTTAIPLAVLIKILMHATLPTPVDKERPQEIANFLTANPSSYVLPPLTISIVGDYEYTPSESSKGSVSIGVLTLAINVDIAILDGNYRAIGIKKAIEDLPSLSNETVSVVIFPNLGNQTRMFGEIKANQRKPGRLERIVDDKTDSLANITRDVISSTSAFKDSIEFRKTTISNRSKNLFTFSGLYQANEALLVNHRTMPMETQRNLAIEFWNTVQDSMPDWTSEEPRVSLRKQTVHAHGVTLCAIAMAGAKIIQRSPKTWKLKLGKLRQIDWSRNNVKLWEGKAMLGGRMTKTKASVELTAKAILEQLDR